MNEKTALKALVSTLALLSAAALAEAPVKLYVFDCGMIRFQSVEAFGIGDEETDVRQLAVPCYMIEHAEGGRLLWDGGLPSDMAESPGWQGEGGTQMRLDRTLAEQLSDMGLDLASFDYIAFSHMHFDHAGVAGELTGGTFIIQRDEHEAAFADEVTVFAYEPELYAGLRDIDTLIVEGDHDVFGDGRVRIVSTPGHTPGHQVLLVDLERTGPVLLSGDLYHFRLSYEDGRVPTFNVDADRTRESMRRVDRLLENTGAELWIQHEMARFQTLERAPAYYD